MIALLIVLKNGKQRNTSRTNWICLIRKGGFIGYKLTVAVLSLLIVLSGCGRYINSVKTPPKANKINFVSTYDTVQRKSVEETTIEKTTISTIETTISKVETKPTETIVVAESKEEIESYSEIEKYIEAETEPTEEVTENIVTDNDSDTNIDLLARIIYFESGNCSEYCQWLVGSTAMNLANEYGSLETVAFNYDIFNVANILYTDTPSSLSYSVATRIINGDRDVNVRAFRTDYYHSFGSPYTNVDNVYFSSY